MGSGGRRHRVGAGHGRRADFRHTCHADDDHSPVTDIATLASDVLEPESFFQIVAPYRTLNAYHGNYFGVVPLVLVLWWLRVSRLPAAAATTDADPRNHLFPASGNRETAVRLVSWWALLLAIVTMWLAFGLPGKLYCLQTWLPLVGKFRSPFRYLLVTQFSVAILAALAFARLVALVRSGEKVAWHDLILPWAAFAAALVVAIGDASDAGRLFYPVHPQQQFLAGPLFVGAAAGALTLAARGRGGGLVLLVLVAAIDFGLYTLGSPQGSIIWRKWEQSASSSQKLPRYEEYLARWPGPPSHKGRLYDDRFEGWIPVANHHCLNGYRVVTGYAGGLWPIQRLDYHHINSLRTAEVAWCWHPQALTASLIGLGPPLNGGWRSVPKPLPRGAW